MKKNRIFYEGQKVRWNDPGINDYEPEDRADVLNRVFVITEVYNETEFAYICEVDGPSQAEVNTWELEPLDNLESHTVTAVNCREKVKVFIVYNPETDSFWYAIEGAHSAWLSKGKPFKSGQQLYAVKDSDTFSYYGDGTDRHPEDIADMETFLWLLRDKNW